MSVMSRVLNKFGYAKQQPQTTREPRDRNTSRVTQATASPLFGFYEQKQAPDNLDNYLRAYNAHAWLYAGVSAIARNAARVPAKIYKRKAKGGREELNEGWAVDLIKQPNEFMTRTRMIYSIAAYKTLVGDAFLEKNDPKKPTRLWLLQPTNMSIVKDPKIKINRWQYTVNGQTIDLPVDEVMHFTNFNPVSEYFGTADVAPLRRTLIIDWYAQQFESDYFENGGNMQGMFSSPKEMDDDIFNRTLEYIKEIGGYRKHHKNTLFDNDMKYNRLGANPNEANVLFLREFDVREVLAVLGVPRMLVQDSKDASWANAKEQLITFWREKEIPLLKDVEDVFNNDVFYQHDLEMEFDTSVIEVLREDMAQKIETANKAVEKGLFTINEVRHEMFKKPPVPWGDKVRFPLTEIESEEFKLEIQKRQAAVLNKMRSRWAKLFIKALRKYFKSMEDQYIKNAELKGDISKSEIIKINVDDLLVDLTKEQQRLIEEVTTIEANALDDYAEFGWSRISTAKRPTFLTASRKAFMDNNIRKFADEINETTLKSLRNHITQGIKANETMPEITKRVKQVFADTVREKDSRAETIARTEMLKVENYAQTQSFADAGATHKTWIASGPPDDRPGHTAIDGETVPIDQPFSNGMMYPGDPGADVSEIANCRCTIAPSMG